MRGEVVVIVAVLTLVAGCLALVLRHKRQVRELLSRERLAALDKGMDVPWGIEPRPRGTGRHHLRGGVIVAGIGLGLAAVAPLQSEPRDARMALAWGLFFLVFGLVNIGFDVLVGRKEAERARELDEALTRAYVRRLEVLPVRAGTEPEDRPGR